MDIKGELTAICGDRVHYNKLLGSCTTFGIGGPADYFVEVHNEQELLGVLELAQSRSLPWLVLGFGSNVLISDTGVRGIVLKLSGEFASLKLNEDKTIETGAAVRVPKFVTFAAGEGFSGMEFLIGIPGTIGGSIYMNAGIRDGEMSDCLKEVKLLQAQSRKLQVLKKEEIQFKYRWSSLQETKDVVTSAVFQLPLAQDKRAVFKKIEAYMAWRKEKQPVNTNNVGSVFKNPLGDFAARLIEAAGLKGARVGQAMVSPLHANFIVNLGGAKASDVLQLMRSIQKTVYGKFQVQLETEVRLIGDFNE